MLRIDKRTPEEIEEVIRWCQNDSFWQANILSTKKLREKFDQLAIKMQKQKDPINFLKGFKGMDLTEEEKKLIGKVSPTTIQNLRAAKRWLERTTKEEESEENTPSVEEGDTIPDISRAIGLEIEDLPSMSWEEIQRRFAGRVSPTTLHNLYAAKRWLEKTTKEEEGNNGRKIQG